MRNSLIRAFFAGFIAVGTSVLTAGRAAGGASGMRDSVENIRAAIQDEANVGRPFVLVGDVLEYFHGSSNEWHVCISTAEGIFALTDKSGDINPGSTSGLDNYALLDRIRFHGQIIAGDHPGDKPYLGFLHAERLSAGNSDQLPELTLSELSDQDNLNRLVHIRGTVRAAARDESDPNFVHLMLRRDGASAHIHIHTTASTPFNPELYLGGIVRATGIFRNFNNTGLRRHLGHTLAVSDLENIRILTPPATPDAAPDLETLADLTPSQIADSGLVRVQGSVLATWDRASLLLKSTTGRLVRIQLQQSGAPPAFGESITVLGLPVTDFYSINLLHASWQPAGRSRLKPPPARDATPTSLLAEQHGKPQLMVRQQGMSLRFIGIIRYLPDANAPERVLQIESDGYPISVDVSALPQLLDQLRIGSKISVAGTCIVNVDNWNADELQNVSRRFFLVPRSPEDLVVLARPPWWTPFRLLCVIAALLLVLAAILVWNTMLRRLAERRGRELADEQVKSVTSELKVYERTHLAVELHDSLSQTLSGVSMQIDAVKRFAGTNPERMNQHLEIAAKTLKSCRDELRNCLLDLRSNALEEGNMNEAIKTTLEPYLDDADIAIRFFIPREIFSDNTAHTVLRIVRELVVNALRHGQADKISIAGSIEGRTLKFSIRDNGCGFEPDAAPGIADGHFGLQGIRERIDELGGTFEIASTPGKGSKATVSILLPQDSTGDGNG